MENINNIYAHLVPTLSILMETSGTLHWIKWHLILKRTQIYQIIKSAKECDWIYWIYRFGLINSAYPFEATLIKHRYRRTILIFVPMNKHVSTTILKCTGARKITAVEEIQPLWNNYGTLSRIYLQGNPKYPSVILKHIQIPKQARHPRGFASSFSKQRKIKSYQVETHWYQHYNQQIAQSTSCPCQALYKPVQNRYSQIVAFGQAHT